MIFCKLKDRNTKEILDLNTPICFVSNGCAYEFSSIKELTEAFEDISKNE